MPLLSLQKFIGLSLVCFFLANFAFSEDNNSKQNSWFQRTTVQEGIVVDLTMEPLIPVPNRVEKFLEEEHVRFRFKLTDQAGNPLTGAYPAGWMGQAKTTPESKDQQCKHMVETYIAGSILAQPDVNLNIYYVLTLNDDATISVVDPLFGFGGSKLLTFVRLESPGYDWVLTNNQRRLYVSLPDSRKITVVNTDTWEVETSISLPEEPRRVFLQPDGQYLWVSYRNLEGESGVIPINTTEHTPLAPIRTGIGYHELTFSDNNRYVFVSNSHSNTVSVIDVLQQKKLKDLKTGDYPISLDFSPLGQVVYVAHFRDGKVAVIDTKRLEVVTKVSTFPGLQQIRFAPKGRYAFAINSQNHFVYIIDVASNRLVQMGSMEKEPDHVSFSDEIAYIRQRGSENVLMINLDITGNEDEAIHVIDFPGGQVPFGTPLSPATNIVQAPGASAILVSHPSDKTIYYYKEGMAAPMGSFNNYSRIPKAVLPVDRSLKERQPGVYETIARLEGAGDFKLAFFMDAPRVVHCFEITVSPDPVKQEQRSDPVLIEYRMPNPSFVQVNEKVTLQFRLKDLKTKLNKIGIQDLQVVTFLQPGIWQRRLWAKETQSGIYQVEFTPPRSGLYHLFVGSASQQLPISNPQFLVLQAQ